MIDSEIIDWLRINIYNKYKFIIPYFFISRASIRKHRSFSALLVLWHDLTPKDACSTWVAAGPSYATMPSSFLNPTSSSPAALSTSNSRCHSAHRSSMSCACPTSKSWGRNLRRTASASSWRWAWVPKVPYARRTWWIGGRCPWSKGVGRGWWRQPWLWLP